MRVNRSSHQLQKHGGVFWYIWTELHYSPAIVMPDGSVWEYRRPADHWSKASGRAMMHCTYKPLTVYSGGLDV